ncbi:hypothetical protein CC86DRAFT_414107 [Ophiobolus disseminans]|uniref:Uncharacterized protein n=1 Tax=Ophiobolus disseminans TaxID=1469910 RepID=A0A6A6ZDA9_9PLEO|nr:hypothetical protein CC86DRAFT_414107 [Ophiobolus disseminans]
MSKRGPIPKPIITDGSNTPMAGPSRAAQPGTAFPPATPTPTYPSGPLTYHSYVNYQVPWNGGVTVGNWFSAYVREGPARQKEMVDEWLISLTEYYDLTAAVVACTRELFTQNSELMKMYGGVKVFRDRYPILDAAKDREDKRRKEVESAISLVRRLEPTAVKAALAPYSYTAMLSQSGSTTMGFLIRRFTFQSLVPYLNTAYYQRRSNPKASQDAQINTTDWVTVRALLQHFSEHLSQHLQSEFGGKVPDIVKQKRQEAAALGLTLVSIRTILGNREKQIPSWDEFWSWGLSWFGSTTHRGKGISVVQTVPLPWLQERQIQFEPLFGLIVPYSEAVGNRLEPQNVAQVVSGAEYAASGQTATGVELRGRDIQINANYGVEQTPLLKKTQEFITSRRSIRSRS